MCLGEKRPSRVVQGPVKSHGADCGYVERRLKTAFSAKNNLGVEFSFKVFDGF